MKILRVNSTKFFDQDRLNTQIEKVMKKLGHTSGFFQLGMEYERTGMIYLILK